MVETIIFFLCEKEKKDGLNWIIWVYKSRFVVHTTPHKPMYVMYSICMWYSDP